MKLRLRRRRRPAAGCTRCWSIAERRHAAEQLAAEMASWPAPVDVLREAAELPPLQVRRYPEHRFHFDGGERQLLDEVARSGRTERWTWPGP